MLLDPSCSGPLDVVGSQNRGGNLPGSLFLNHARARQGVYNIVDDGLLDEFGGEQGVEYVNRPDPKSANLRSSASCCR